MKTTRLFISILAIVLTSVLWFTFHIQKTPGISPLQAVAPQVMQKLDNQIITRLIPNQPNSPPSAGISPSLRPVLDEQQNPTKRYAMAQTMAITNLADADIKAIYGFLLKRSASDEDQYGQALKNVLMDTLCAVSPPPLGLADILAQIYQDRGQDIVLRDYAVQHLAAFYERMQNATAEQLQARDGELTEARTTLWRALSETDSSVAGTALLGLSHLSQENLAGFDQDQISRAALKLVGDNSIGELTRITAIQVSANLGVKDALPLVLVAAQQGGTVPIQISAIGALGALGGPDQVTFLNGLIQANDNRLAIPAQQALKQIEEREKLTALANRRN